VEEMATLPKLRDYLKLYSTTDVAKVRSSSNYNSRRRRSQLSRCC